MNQKSSVHSPHYKKKNSVSFTSTFPFTFDHAVESGQLVTRVHSVEQSTLQN